MLKIRLQRVGRKHEPNFRIVLTDSENSTKSGRYKEVLGSYDPRKSVDQINAERAKYWLSQGAEATGTVHNLLVTHKIIDAKKMNVLPRKKPIIKEKEAVAEVAPEAPVAEPVAEVPVEEAPVSTEATAEPVVQ
jgi:small subunit ribosomal protein S16